MSARCAPCNRSFKEQTALDQHIRDSPAHKKQQAAFLIKPAKPQALRHHIQPTKREHGQLPSATISGSSTPQITIPAVKTISQDIPWSMVMESEYGMVRNALSAHCHTPMELQENGFIIHPYNALDYANSRKCKRCNSQEKNVVGRDCIFHLYKRNKRNSKRPYKCCSDGGRGCKISPTHDFQMPLRAIKHEDFRQTPPASAETKCLAVALDCEMAGVAGGGSEAILLCVTDYLTGAVLLNRYVSPREPIIQMRSSIHGISKSILETATRQGQTLRGWEAARLELWKYIDSNTIIVGHALQHDLDALRMIHPRIVDSAILSRNAVGIHRIRWGLQTLCSELVHIQIRKNKEAIHDCLEDVLAAREVILFCTLKEEAFQTWAEATKFQELRLEKERESRRQKKQSRNYKVTVGGGSGYRICPDSDEEGEEVLHWPDIAEDLGWPHPDTGYDPWSD
ncbi:hypothetical protein ACMFMG_011697 [Clarireedia jacksonii]